ncbi:hypothetical protein Q5752_003186 [Cryptotrichosporon argae]
MPDHPALAYLRRQYPSPPINSTWVEHIVAALQEAGEPSSNDEIHRQFLHSDLSLSTLAPPAPVPTPGSLCFPRPTILQIHGLHEIGASAFALQTTADSRREFISGAARIRTMDHDEEVDEGKMPVYSRSMLRLELSNGHHAMTAIEYKRLNDLTLGETQLGTKLLVQNVHMLKDTLLLSPETTRVLGGSVEHLEAEQPRLFVESLQARLANPQPKLPVRKSAGSTRGRLTLPVTARAARSARPAPAPAPASAASSASASDAARARRAAVLGASAPAPSRPVRGPPAHVPSDSTLGDDSFQIDDAFLREMDEAERRAVGASTSASVRAAARPRGAPGRQQAPAYVDVESDEDALWAASGDWDDPIELSD